LKKIFFTGGTGFFGLAVLRFLQGNKEYDEYSVYLFTRNISRFKSRCPKSIELKNIEFIEGDILEPSSFPANNFDYIIHAAADSTDGQKLDHLFRSSQIVDGTRNILEWCKNSEVNKFLFISSGGVYGKIYKPVQEHENICPTISNIDNTYSVSKMFAEHLCFLYANRYDFSISVARCFSFIGQDLPRDAHFAVGNFLRDVIDNKPITINGDGSPVRSFMDQGDLAHWLLTILFFGGNNQVYNVGSDEEISTLNLAELVKKIFQSNLPINIEYKSVTGQAKGRNYYVPNIDKAKTDLGLRLNCSLEDSVLKILEATINCEKF
jgi:dTDP-glucose 4,6-dehydratase